MKAKMISYARLVNIGNYEHIRIELQAEIEKGDNVSEVFEKVKMYIDKKCAMEADYRVKKAKEILKDRINHKVGEVEEAEKLLKEYQQINDLF